MPDRSPPKRTSPERTIEIRLEPPTLSPKAELDLARAQQMKSAERMTALFESTKAELRETWAIEVQVDKVPVQIAAPQVELPRVPEMTPEGVAQLSQSEDEQLVAADIAL
ncbi:MAG: hypothetical protein AAFV29_00490 [Myxococcota bacterium]